MDESGNSPHQDETPKESAASSPISATIVKLLRPVSILSYLLSLPILGCGIWLLLMHDYDCEDILHAYRLRYTLAMGMLIFFIISNLVVFYGLNFPLPGLLSIMVVATIMLTLGLALVGTYKVESRGLPASPIWLKVKVMDDEHWNKIKACIYGARICYDLAYRTQGLTEFDFNLKKLSSIEWGCCKPPTICGMEYVNATYWNPERSYEDDHLNTPIHAHGGDCDAWSNIQSQLCFDCQSCRDGFLRLVQQRWKRLGVFIVVMTVFHVVMHISRFTMIMLIKNMT